MSMPKPEHAGGPPEVGFVRVDSWEETSFPVPITHFPFESLDTTEDRLTEALRSGKPITDIVRSLVKRHEMDIRIETLDKIVGIVLSHKDKERTFYELAFTGRLAMVLDLSGAEIARRFGMRKQAFQQQVKRFGQLLGIEVLPTGRNEQAKQRMRKCNYRKKSHGPNPSAV